MTTCYIERQIDRHADWLGVADAACDWYYGTSEEQARWKQWVADLTDEVESGESIDTDLSLATYRESTEWEDHAIEEYTADRGDY